MAKLTIFLLLPPFKEQLEAGDGGALCSDFSNTLVAKLENQGIVARRRNMVFGAGA